MYVFRVGCFAAHFYFLARPQLKRLSSVKVGVSIPKYYLWSPLTNYSKPSRGDSFKSFAEIHNQFVRLNTPFMEQKEYVRLAADVIDEIYSLTKCYNQIIKTGRPFSEAKEIRSQIKKLAIELKKILEKDDSLSRPSSRS